MTLSGRTVRASLIALVVLILGPLLAAAAWLISLRGDPFRFLERDLSSVAIVRDSSYARSTASGEGRLYRDIELESRQVGRVRFTLSLPIGPIDEEKLPVVLVLGGLEVGRRSLDYIGYHGRNALLGYEYPYSPEYWYEGSPLTEIPAIQKAVFSVPSQVAAVIGWTNSQAWVDRSRILLLGYSFGAFFVPATYRVVERSGVDLRAGVLAYGGADLETVFYANLKTRGAFRRTLLAKGAAALLAPMEPARHLPHITDEFLILNGTRDELIPSRSIEILRRLKPEPKTVIDLDARHMNPKRPELNRVIGDKSRSWLLEKRLIEP